jgi:hypothetical protein
VNRGDFAKAVLAQLGAPASDSNIAFLVGMMQREGGTATFNPLNSTLVMPGSSSYNPVGVQNYPDAPTGVAATAHTLANGYYPNIIADLRAGDGQRAANEGADLSKWSGGGYRSIQPDSSSAGTTIAGSSDGGGFDWTAVVVPFAAAADAAGVSVPNPLDALSAVASLLAKFVDPRVWLRVLMLLAGAGLAAAGLGFIIADTSGGRAALEAGATAAAL